MKAKKGSKIFFDTFVGVNEYIPQGKWQAEMGDIRENECIRLTSPCIEDPLAPHFI